MFCDHTDVMVQPSEIMIVNNRIQISGLTSGTMWCRDCKEELPIEDLLFYDSIHVSVAIPQTYTDKLNGK